jgi:hypothetical protein
VIIPFIRTRKGSRDILADIKEMKIGLNQELILLVFGLAGCYGINQQLKRVIKT